MANYNTIFLSLCFFSTLFLMKLSLSSATLYDCTTLKYGSHYSPKAAIVLNLHYTNSNRKILLGVQTNVESESPIYNAEMRNVPSGPDPMHHSSGPQKRPRITP